MIKTVNQPPVLSVHKPNENKSDLCRTSGVIIQFIPSSTCRFFCGRPVAYMAAKRMAHRPHELATAERKAVEIRFSQL